jgi:hypothetical protein
MKDLRKPIFFFILALLGSSCLSLAQEVVTPVEDLQDTIAEEYIQDHKTQLNVKFEVSNDINEFTVDYEGSELLLKPNLDLRYGLVFSYKFLSVRLGIRPRPTDMAKQEKGESDTFRLRFKMLFENWSHVFQYNYDRGYYVSNTSQLFDEPQAVRIQFPYLTSHIFFGTSVFKFNENYSVRSIESQTEIQVKSAGSLLIGLNYGLYKLFGTDRVLLPDGNLEFRDFNREYNGFNLAPTVGYYYTFVLKKHWFINAYGVPSAGIEVYQTKSLIQGESETDTNTDFFVALDYGFGGGYNGEKIFFGAQLVNRRSNAKFAADKIQIQPKRTTFSFYIGYRFKAPKTVRQPVDLIEEKVPILKDKSNVNQNSVQG